jgi:quinol monooxygenase YgiN
VTQLAIFDCDGVLIDSDQNPFYRVVNASSPYSGRQAAPAFHSRRNTNCGAAMPIYQTAHYQVRLDAVDRVKTAIEEFVRYVTENEPGSRLYSAWQEVEDPTKFVHLFIFEDEAAHEAHGRSAAVTAFEDVYKPELTAGPVVFTDYELVATNTP